MLFIRFSKYLCSTNYVKMSGYVPFTVYSALLCLLQTLASQEKYK